MINWVEFKYFSLDEKICLMINYSATVYIGARTDCVWWCTNWRWLCSKLQYTLWGHIRWPCWHMGESSTKLVRVVELCLDMMNNILITWEHVKHCNILRSFTWQAEWMNGLMNIVFIILSAIYFKRSTIMPMFAFWVCRTACVRANRRYTACLLFTSLSNLNQYGFKKATNSEYRRCRYSRFYTCRSLYTSGLIDKLY